MAIRQNIFYGLLTHGNKVLIVDCSSFGFHFLRSYVHVNLRMRILKRGQIWKMLESVVLKLMKGAI